jgi:hypothetical protein
MVVIATAPVANDGLADALRAANLTVQVIGDALAPRDIEYAVFEGNRAARAM